MSNGDWPSVEFALLKRRLRKVAPAKQRQLIVELITRILLDELDRSGGNSADVLNEILKARRT